MGKRIRAQRKGSSPRYKVSSHRFPGKNRMPRVSDTVAEVTELVHSPVHTGLTELREMSVSLGEKLVAAETGQQDIHSLQAALSERETELQNAREELRNLQETTANLGEKLVSAEGVKKEIQGLRQSLLGKEVEYEEAVNRARELELMCNTLKQQAGALELARAEDTSTLEAMLLEKQKELEEAHASLRDLQQELESDRALEGAADAREEELERVRVELQEARRLLHTREGEFEDFRCTMKASATPFASPFIPHLPWLFKLSKSAARR